MQDGHLDRDPSKRILNSGYYIEGNSLDKEMSKGLFKKEYPVYRRGPD